MILILGSEDDLHTRRICDHLDQVGMPYVILCAANFPVSDFASMVFADGSRYLRHHSKHHDVNLNDISVVWFRRVFSPILTSSITDPEAARFASSEARAFLRGMWGVLSDRPWLNDFHRVEIAESKPFQLAAAQKVGLRIPKTIITNDVSAVASFFDQVNGPVIYKPLTSYATAASFVDGKVVPSRCIYTNVVDRDSLDRLAAQIALAPCLFQEYVPKEVELRITVVGDDFFTAAIHSQQSQHSKVDWRKYDLENTPYRPYLLPPDAQSRISALLDELGLSYGAIDCILRPDGEIVFLEINPAGQWLWIEELTGMKIAESIANELVRLADKSLAKI